MGNRITKEKTQQKRKTLKDRAKEKMEKGVEKIKGAYLNYEVNNLDTVQGRVHFNIESRKNDLKRRAKERLAKWRGEQNRAILTEQLGNMLRQYDSVPAVKSGVLNAIEKMAPELGKDLKTIIKRRTAKRLKDMIYKLGSDPMHRVICTVAQEVAKQTSDNETVARNTFLIAYDWDFKNKSYTYDTLESLITAGTILTTYKNYDSYLSFFDKHGISDVKKVQIFGTKILFKDTGYVGEYNGASNEIILDKKAEDKTAVHEIAHSRQYNGKKEISYGKATGAHVNADDITSVVLESGAIFSEMLYSTLTAKSLPHLPKGYRTAIEVDALKRYTESYLFQKLGRSTKETPNELIKTTYDIMREIHDSHDLLGTWFSRYPTGKSHSKYYDGTTLALLMFAANDFDSKQTLKILLTFEKPSEVIDKLSKLIKKDSNFKILEKLQYISL